MSTKQSAIPKAEIDINHAAKLRAESAGILLWLVEGARRFIADGLDPPDSVLAPTAEYRHDEDTPARFVTECLEMRNSWVRSIDIKHELERWCNDQDITPPLRLDEITPLLKSAGCQTERRTVDGRKSVVWRGVCLADDTANTMADQA